MATMTIEAPETEFTFPFDEHNINWIRSQTYNLMFLESLAQYFHNKLQAQGYLFLNDVLDGLGIARIPDGQLVGWLKDGDNSRGIIEFTPDDHPIQIVCKTDGVIYTSI